jgi:hypothetical protein
VEFFEQERPSRHVFGLSITVVSTGTFEDAPQHDVGVCTSEYVEPSFEFIRTFFAIDAISGN